MKITRKRFIAFSLILAFVGCAFFFLAVFLSWLFIDWNEEGSEDFPAGFVLRDSSGEIIRVVLGEGDVDCRPNYIADENDWIVKAIVAAEDGDFWIHNGVRSSSIARAFFQNIFYRRRISGASTISMQLVRLIHPHKKSYCAKWVEIFEAMKMEKRRSKIWILSQYLNRAPFGSNYIGIESAAHGWFGKSAKELGPAEAAMLAAMVQAPSRLRPDRDKAGAMKRRNYVLKRMHELGYLDDDTLEGVKKSFPDVKRAVRPFKHPYYCDWFISTIDRNTIPTDYDITTPLDSDIQELCEKIVAEGAKEGGWSVAAVVIKIDSSRNSRKDYGNIVALSCSGNYFDQNSGQFNTAISPRPAGSTLKPFLAALALDLGIVAPEERLKDIPISYKGYRPANFDSTYRNNVSLRDSLILSLNIPFITMLEKLGLDRFGNTLQSLGFENMNDSNDQFGLGMAIGNVEVSLLELTRAYALFSKTASGDDNASVFLPSSAYIISDMLSGEERSDASIGHFADVKLPRFAWKTGTSSGYRDAWCVAWNSEWAIGVWAGYKRGNFGNEKLTGAEAAAPHVWRIARALYPSGDGPWFSKPDSVEIRKLCKISGNPPSADCPAVKNGLYINSSASAPICSIHRRNLKGEIIDINEIASRSKTRKLSISKPENGATYTLVNGLNQQGIVAHVLGNDSETVLWWFLDGVPQSRSVGSQSVLLKIEKGEHELVCVDSSGNCAKVSFCVK